MRERPTHASDLPTHANFDQILCLVPGLFRLLKRGTRKQRLELRGPQTDNASAVGRAETFEFRSKALLGADDLSVLQGVLAFARQDASED